MENDMTPDQYLDAVVNAQTFASDDPELAALRERGNEVKDLLRGRLSSHNPSVRNAGSHAKGTMIRASYDLDVLTYFPASTAVGENLEQIYDAVAELLGEEYSVEKKRSALRLLDANGPDDPVYFHVDVVPGRFVDDGDGDVFLHQESGEKARLKTNPEIHIEHVRDSGVHPAIKLMKLWKVKNGLVIPTFILELLAINLLAGVDGEKLSDQLTHVLTEIRDRADSLTVSDPANSGNDLSDIFTASIRETLSSAADSTLQQLEQNGWQAVFGVVDDSIERKSASLLGAAAMISTPSRPYFCER